MMKSALFRSVVTACFMLLLAPSVSISAQERRTALVIGNGAYKSSPLVNPVNDATDIASALKKLGFSVRLKINANQRSMENAIRDFGKELRSDSVGLFYFAGHGIQVYGRNYLIPIGANIESEADVKYESVDAGRVLSQMYEAQNGLNIIILDACRDNPYARSFRSSEKGLAKMDAPTGSILAYSTAPGSVAADGTGRNGLYTSMLLKHIMTPELEVGKLFRQVRIDVVRASNEMQIPWESSSLMGDFYFNPKRGIIVETRTETNSESPAKEMPKYAALYPEHDRPYKLAIFPWKLNVSDAPQSYKFCMKIIIKAINDTLDQTQLFNPAFSYYKIDKKFNTKMISDSVSGIDRVWGWSFFSNYKPNINKISEIGKQLNVDAVLMYSFLIAKGDDSLKVYLVDAKKKKIYYAAGATWDFSGEGDLEIKNITKKVFSEYQTEQ